MSEAKSRRQAFPGAYAKASKQRRKRWKRKAGEPRISDRHHYLGRMAIRSQITVAKMMGLTPQRVYQLERNAIWKLRRAVARILREAVAA